MNWRSPVFRSSWTRFLFHEKRNNIGANARTLRITEGVFKESLNISCIISNKIFYQIFHWNTARQPLEMLCNVEIISQVSIAIIPEEEKMHFSGVFFHLNESKCTR